MKIIEFNIYPFSFSLNNFLINSKQSYNEREGFWLEIKSENCCGYGEAAPLSGFSKENLHEIYYAFQGFFHAVKNEQIDLEELLLLAEIHCLGCPSARFAIETAIYDILSKELKISISRYLNVSSLSKIKVNGIIGAHSESDNFKVLKLKVGISNIFDEVDSLKKLKELYGDEVLFRLDANGIFDLPKAIRFCKEVEKFNIDYIEQPLPPDKLEDLEELQYHTDISIALDESITSLESVEKVIDLDLAQAYIIKPMISGGFIESGKIIELAKSKNIRSIISSSLETSIGRMACIHLAASNNISEACGLATDCFIIDKWQTPKIKNGILKLDEIPGIGLEIEF